MGEQPVRRHADRFDGPLPRADSSLVACLLRNRAIAIHVQVDSLGQAQDLSAFVAVGMPKVHEIAAIQLQHLHLAPGELLRVLYSEVRPAPHPLLRLLLLVRRVHRKRVGQHVELVAQVPERLHPLHLVEAVVDETLVEGWEMLAAAHHHVRLEETLLETLDVGDRGGWREGLPVGGKVVLGVRNGGKRHVGFGERSEDGAVVDLQTAVHGLLGGGHKRNGPEGEGKKQRRLENAFLEGGAGIVFQHGGRKRKGGNDGHEEGVVEIGGGQAQESVVGVG